MTDIDLDWDRTFALRQACDDADLLAELLELMCSSSGEDLGKLRRSLEHNLWDDVILRAHNIKGAAASMGMAGLKGTAAMVEEAARKGDFKAVAKIVEEQLAKMIDLIAELS